MNPFGFAPRPKDTGDIEPPRDKTGGYLLMALGLGILAFAVVGPERAGKAVGLWE